MTEIMVYRHAAVQPGSSQRKPPPTVYSEDGRGDLILTPLPGIDDMIIDKRTRAPCLPLASRPSNGLLISRSSTSTNMSLSRTRGAGWPSINRRPSYWGNGGCHDGVLAHRSRAGRTAMALAPATTLHRRLG
jgi:hypothetical protein